MKLLPSLKQKKRYVLFEISAKQKFNFTELKPAVEEAIQQFLGDLGKGRASPMLLKEKFNKDTQRFIIKVNHKHVDELKAALMLIKKIKNVPVMIKSITVSGTLKKANK